MISRFYVTSSLGTDSVSERFLALDATSKAGKAAEFRVIRYRRELCSRPEVAAALELEAVSELPLTHVNILHLAGAGVWDGGCFFAYEKGDFVSLAEGWKRAGRNALEPAVVAGITIPVLEALAYAHSGHEDRNSRRPQVFHTGFTPDSILLSRKGLVKVRGFTAPALGGSKRPGTLDQILGRVPYLAPEVLDGKPAGASSDLFSLGALLWELLSGQPLFRRGSPDESEAAVRNKEVPPVSSFSPLVPAEIDSFVSRLLIRDPAFRFGSALEAKAALEKALFASDMSAEQNTYLAWCQGLGAGAGMKETADARKVIAEIVSTREIVKTLAARAAPAPVAEPAENGPRDSRPEPRPAEDLAPWEKTRTKIVDDEPEPEERKGVQVPPKLVAALAAALLLCVAGVGAWIFFPDYLSLDATLGAAVSKIASLRHPEPAAPAMSAVFAFRGRQDGSRRVFVQGLRQESENFFIPCGEDGKNCRCDFYLAPDDVSPVVTSPASISRKFNYVFCDLPENASAVFVRVVATGDRPRKTNLLKVAGQLSWQDILGVSLDRRRVRWVSRYECDRTFLEGEGVDPAGGAITCSPGQHLGILTTTFSYYVYQSEEDRSEPGRSAEFRNAVCGITNLTRIRCQDTRFTPQFGVYREEAAPFLLPVSLYRAPEGTDPISVVGYAAGPDTKGNCPVGLSPVKMWNAEAPSLDEKSEGAGVPSNFTNKTGELSDRVFSPIEPRPFVVVRRKNRTPCDGKGDCALAAFEEARSALTVPYRLLATLCVLPASYLEEPPASGDAARKAYGATAEAPPEATVELKTQIPSPDVMLNGRKAAVEGGKLRVPLHVALKFEVSKPGYRTQKIALPPLEAVAPVVVDVPTVKVLVGNVDLDCFPRAEVSFWLGDEMVFSGTTPVKESLPAGKYKVKFKTLRSGTESEREVVIQDGKTTVVDQLIHEKSL